MDITTRALRRAARAMLAAAAMHGGLALAGAGDTPFVPAPTASAAIQPAAAPATLAAAAIPGSLGAGASPAALGPAVTPAIAAPAATRGRSHHILGLSVDAGVPDGASATVLYRPWKYVRFGGGM